MSSDPRFEKIVAEYVENLRLGAPPDRRLLLDQNPEFADELKSFFADHDQRQRATTSVSEDVTLRPGEVFAAGPTGTGAAPPPVAQPPSATEKRRFGEYELIEEIARGGMGVVYKARQVRLGRTVALKMILAGQLAGQDDINRFHTEAEAAAALDHPGIVPIYDVGEHDGHHYFSMGFIGGLSLAEKIKDGPLPTIEAVQYTKMVAETMAYAHERGVIHRDLKPANVLLDENGEPKVTDFGLAKRVEGNNALTATGEILGTPSYMSPEQATGKAAVSESTDVYLLGAMLYALITGRPPFQASSAVDTLFQVLEQEPVSPRLLNSDVPADVETIALKCLEKDPERRYGTAFDLAQELDRFLAHKPIVARPVSSVERAWRWSRRHPALAVMLVATSLMAITLFAGATLGYLHERTMRRRLAMSFERQKQLIERQQKLLEFIENGEKVQRYEEAVEAVASDSQLIGALTSALRSATLTEIRDQLNRHSPDEAQAGARRKAFVDHQDRAQLQVYLEGQQSDRDDHHAEVFAWFIQDPHGLQIARAPLGEDNVGHNYARRSYFHGGKSDYETREDYLQQRDPERPHLQRTGVSTAFVTEDTEKWVVAISTPVYDPGNAREFLGVVGVFLFVTPPEP